MTETDFRKHLDEALDAIAREWPDEPRAIYTSSFEEVGLLTSNEGLIVRMDDGSEFQVTIVQSRAADGAVVDAESEEE